MKNKNFNVKIGGAIKYKNEILDIYNSFYYGYNIKIFDSVYDSLNRLKWSGGRFIDNQPYYSNNDFINLIKEYNKKDIIFSINFSSILLKEEDYKDFDCNYILKNIENLNIEVIVADDQLAKYIKINYPKIKIVLSAIKNLTNPIEIDNILQEGLYNKIVVSSDISKDFETLSLLKNKEKIEIIIDEKCCYHCIYRQKHYYNINKYIIEKQKEDNNNILPFIDLKCMAKRDPSYKNSSFNNLEKEDIEKLLNLGFKNLKITHRESPSFLKLLHKELNKIFNIIKEDY